MGIDPGSNTLGISIVDAFLDEQRLEIVHTSTLHTKYKVAREKERAEFFGEFQLKLERIFEEICGTLGRYMPDVAIHETPYMKDHATTYARLTQVNSALANACFTHSPIMRMETIDPSTVKKNVGVPGNSNDKELVRKAVRNIGNLTNVSGVSFDAMSEHEIDATAIAYYYCTTFLGISRRLGKP